MNHDPDEDHGASYALCVGLYGSCFCQDRDARPCEWIANEAFNGTTLAEAKEEMSICRDVMNEEPW